MTQQFELLQSVLYPVELKKTSDLNPGEQTIRRIDTGEILSHVSDRYCLVPNRDLFLPFVEHFGEQSVVGCVPKKRSCTVEIETGRSFDFGNGDVIKERLVVQNSYDRTRSYRFLFGCYRLLCSNGLYLGQMSLSYRKIHTGTIPIEDMIKYVLKEYKSNKFDLWRKMTKVSLNSKQQITAVNRLDCLEIDEDDDGTVLTRNRATNSRIREKAVAYINRPESVENCRNIWGLMNNVNRAIASEIRGGYLLDKRIYANQMAEQYLAKKFNLI